MENKFYYYNKELKQFARDLRKNSTLSEKIMWKELLKSGKLMGYQFLRQRPLDKYIADFLCKELKLIIELDGATHIGKEKKDIKRQTSLENKGFTIIRFKDSEVMEQFQCVKTKLGKWIVEYENSNPEVVLKKRKNSPSP